MGYLSKSEIDLLGFKFVGINVLISDKASIYDADKIDIGDNSRIDDFCVISGLINIGRNVYIGMHSVVAGGDSGVYIEDFAGISYGCLIFSQSDDYSGRFMAGPTVPRSLRGEIKKRVILGRYSAIGAGSIIMPGVVTGEGTSIGAMSLVRKPTESWSIYSGNPLKKIRARKKNIIELAEKYVKGC